ncbi:MAG: hypothetical protein Q9188_006769 [Gyalolechia gomerana]
MALSPPKQLPPTAFRVLLAERAKVVEGPAPEGAKDCSRRYKSLTPEQREHYNHLANQNKAANASRYREWMQSLTPSQIAKANSARSKLNRRTKGKWSKLKDDRLVKGPKSAYTIFYIHRFRSGDFAGVKVPEAGKLLGAEWRGLNADAKKPYFQLAEEESARYAQEVKAVYNRDVRHKAATAA